MVGREAVTNGMLFPFECSGENLEMLPPREPDPAAAGPLSGYPWLPQYPPPGTTALAPFAGTAPEEAEAAPSHARSAYEGTAP